MMNHTTISFDTVLRSSQDNLFSLLHEAFRKDTIRPKQKRNSQYLLFKGTAPVLLVAHLDTVHKEPVKTICRSDDGNILMSPEGIGGDDRCGVYALLSCRENAKYKPWMLFTRDEEIGGIGAQDFAEDYADGLLPKQLGQLKLIIEIDRQGAHDAVYYNCDCPELETYIASKNYITNFGTFSDISVIAPVLGVAAVNLSSGYYNAHTQHEYIVCSELERTIKTITEIVEESKSRKFPAYKYKEKPYIKGSNLCYPYNPNEWDLQESIIPDDLPEELHEPYGFLLDIYDAQILEDARKSYGDNYIAKLFLEEYGDEFC